ncbi:phage tail tip lysozyme [Methylobacterium ajmalii]|uniref:phage tail tip lysozyme n=1 Tax=Methylobacterium ajmalii TaxID=2738439 RepID=UPI002F3183BD
MADDVLKGFLVSLGFKIDDASQKKFQSAVKSAVTQANLLASAIEGAAVAVAKNLFSMSEGFDKLYFASRRTGASVQNIRALSYAFTQVGGTGGEASAAVENFARAMRTNPGVGGFVRSLGVATEVGGKARDTLDVLLESVEKIRARNPHFAGAQLASILGIDEHQFLLLSKSRDEIKKYREEYDQTARMMGLNNDRAAESHNKMATSLRSLSMIGTVAADKLLTFLAPAIERVATAITDWIKSNPEKVELIFKKITEAVEWLGKELIKFTDIAADMIKDGRWLKMWDETLDKTLKLVSALEKVVKFIMWLDDFGQKSNKPIGQAVTGILGNGPNETGSWVPGWAKRGWNGVKRVFSGGVANAGEAGAGGAPGAAAGSGTTPRGNGVGTAGRARMGEMMGYAMEQLRREGVPEGNLRQAAAHLVGQAYMESGLNPNTVHDHGTGYGIYGARDPGGAGRQRRTLMLNWLAANGYAKNSAEGQMRYMAVEAMSKHYPATRRVLMGQGSGNVSADAMTITRTFEAPRFANDRSGAVRSAMEAGPEAPTSSKRPASGWHGNDRFYDGMNWYVRGSDGHLTRERPGVVPLNLPKPPSAFSPGQGGFDVNKLTAPAAPMGANTTTNNNGNTNSVVQNNNTTVKIDAGGDPVAAGRQTERAMNRSSAINLRNIQNAIG